jgi:hypothetical protein
MSVNVTSPSVPKGFTRVKGYATGTLIFSFLTALILLPETVKIKEGAKLVH